MRARMSHTNALALSMVSGRVALSLSAIPQPDKDGITGSDFSGLSLSLSLARAVFSFLSGARDPNVLSERATVVSSSVARSVSVYYAQMRESRVKKRTANSEFVGMPEYYRYRMCETLVSSCLELKVIISTCLVQAITVAIRYSAIRRQGRIEAE